MKSVALVLSSVLLPLSVPAVPPAAATAVAPSRQTVAPEPVRGEWAALSPDGQRVAYSVRDGSTLGVVIAAVESPTHVLARVVVGRSILTGPRQPTAFDAAPQIEWLRWVSDQRITVATAGVQRAVASEPPIVPPPPGPSPYSVTISYGHLTLPETVLARGFVMAFNADGTDARALLTPSQAGGSVRVVGVDPSAPGWLVVTAGGLDRRVNVVTGEKQRVEKATVEAARDAETARHARCVAAQNSVVSKLAQALPGAALAVVDADATGNRLVAVPRQADGAVRLRSLGATGPRLRR